MSTGGRSRYFLAKIQDKYQNTSKEKTRKKYSEVYLNSPSDFYAFKSLKKSLEEKNLSFPKNNIKDIRIWLSKQAGNKANLKKFFAHKKRNKNYAVDPFWKDWEKNLNKLDSANSSVKKAVLFLGMGFNQLATPYLKNVKLIDKLLVYQKAGHLVEDAYLKFSYLKKYAIKKKKSVDVFTLSQKAKESLYPKPYTKYVTQASHQFDVEKERLYALMKTRIKLSSCINK